MYDNLTGEQIQIILDLFLYKALEPVVVHSTVFDTQVSYLLNLTTGNRKRKISSIERETVIELLASYLVATDRREKFEIVRSARIERSFIHTFLSRFQSHNREFMSLYREYMVNAKSREVLREQLDYMARQAGCASREDLYRIMSLVDGYLRNFYNYRTTVVDHYVKMASKQAASYIESNPSMNYDFMDVRQNILKSVLIAIDKYDSDRGPLTSYINWWVLNALTCGTDEHEYGIAYTIPQTQRKKLATGSSGEVNFSVSLDGMANDDEDGERNLHSSVSSEERIAENIERDETDDIIRYLIKSVDQRGTARLLLDIGEYFSAQEIEKMDQQMRSEFGHLLKSNPAPVAIYATPKPVELKRGRRFCVRKVNKVTRRAYAALSVNRDTRHLIGDTNGHR